MKFGRGRAHPTWLSIRYPSMSTNIPSTSTLPTTDPKTRRRQLREKKRIMAQLDQRLSPPRDRAVFWSGALWLATEYCRRCGKATLETGLKRAGIEIPLDSPYTYELWCYASKLWADRSKGKTEAVLGHHRPASIYCTVELPALARNRKVTQHVEYLTRDIRFASKVSKQRRDREDQALVRRKKIMSDLRA